MLKNYFWNIIVVTVFLLLAAPCKSREVSFEPGSIPNLPPETVISGMCQDNNGFVWFATNTSGLYKYDGSQLINYSVDENNPTSIISNRMECICAGKDGDIWIGSFENGLDRFDPETETFTHYQHDNADSSSIRSDSIRAIIESEDGILWIGTANGLDSFDPKTEKFTHYNGESPVWTDLNKSQIRVIYEDKAGSIWIGGGSPFFADYNNNFTEEIPGGLYKLDRKTGQIKQYLHSEGDKTSLVDNRVGAIFEDSRGVFWVGTAGDGLHTMDRKKGTFHRHQNDPKNPNKLSRPPAKEVFDYAVEHITFINQDSRGQIWIGTFNGGINRYNPVTDKVEHFGTSATGPNKIGHDNFWACLKTTDNLLWISTNWVETENRHVFYKVSTTSGKLNYSETGTRIFDFSEDLEGNMWFASSQGLLKKTNNNNYQRFLPEKNGERRNNIILHIEKDLNDNFWLSTPGGLYFFDTKSYQFKAYLHNPNNVNSISSDTVFVSRVDDNGTIWIGTFRGLDLLDRKTGIFKHFKINPSSKLMLANSIYDIELDSAGNNWIGWMNGIFQIDTNSGRISEPLRVSYLSVNEISYDSHQRIWVGTHDGLWVKYPESNEFTQFQDSLGVISTIMSVWGITEDMEHSLWMNTSDGLLRLNPETKNAALFSKSWDINPEKLDDNSLFTSSQGEIFLGDTAGYYHFFPKDLKQPDKNLSNLQLSKLYIDNNEIIPGTNNILPKQLSEMKHLTLNYLQNNFSLEFHNIDFLTAPSEKNVLYMLENYDKNWRNNKGENLANYYNVRPGKYLFRIKASNLYGNWTEKTLEIEIKPPWYRSLVAFIIYFIILAIAVWFVHLFQKKRTIRKVQEQIKDKELAQAKEIEKAYKNLEIAHEDLKTTQTQLIQSEKMASLGELTAGIAHEIQNPLNFVNNFSEVNSELIDEAHEENEKGNSSEVKIILNDLKENEEKIIHHGKRAESIVKGMLLHSRKSSDEKELTDINALADEYLRLSYHGLRAKDKSFNAGFKTNFDESLPKINVVPQDIGRVMLNLINNAFYAVNKKAKSGDKEYKPLVTLSTTSSKSPSGDLVVEIRVQDNGPGIPDSIKDKIFQPFFTTKPTGQGTGLGLSMSYEIIKKGHGGDLTVQTKEGEGTEFTILLALKS